MPIYMCERVFAKPVSEEQFFGAFKVLEPCIKARDVKWVSSHLATDGTRSVCVFDAPDAERIRDANRQAGLPFAEVWPARVYQP